MDVGGSGSASWQESYQKFSSWRFPEDAFNDGGEGEILWANLYQLALALAALAYAVMCGKKPTFVAAMVTFTLFGCSHLIAHGTGHPWTYLPLHYSFVATSLFVGATFGGIQSWRQVAACLVVDFLLIRALGQFVGVASAFTIMVFGLRRHAGLLCVLACSCALIWVSLLFNDVLSHGGHGLTEVCACVALTAGGLALGIHPASAGAPRGAVARGAGARALPLSPNSARAAPLRRPTARPPARAAAAGGAAR